MQFMKRFVFCFLAFMMSTGVAWASERGYRLSWAETAGFVQECWKRFVRIWTVDDGHDIARDFSADYLETGRTEGARAKDEALLEAR